MSELRCLAESRFAFCASPLTSDVDVDADSGLGGRLLTLGLAFGGAGNEPTLVVFRILFPGVGSADVGVDVDVAIPYAMDGLLRVGTAGVD